MVANAAPTKLTKFSKQMTADIYNIIDKNIVFKVFCCFSGFRSFQQKYNENDRNRLPKDCLDLLSWCTRQLTVKSCEKKHFIVALHKKLFI